MMWAMAAWHAAMSTSLSSFDESSSYPYACTVTGTVKDLAVDVQWGETVCMPLWRRPLHNTRLDIRHPLGLWKFKTVPKWAFDSCQKIGRTGDRFWARSIFSRTINFPTSHQKCFWLFRKHESKTRFQKRKFRTPMRNTALKQKFLRRQYFRNTSNKNH